MLFCRRDSSRQTFSRHRLSCDLGNSRSFFSRLVHFDTGVPIHPSLNTLRLRKACDSLLHTPLSIREIALDVGFSDVTYFISAFKRGIGETPLQYRKNHRNEHALKKHL